MSELVQTPELGAPAPIYNIEMQTAIAIAGAWPPRDVEGPAESWMAMLHNLAFMYPPFGAPACAGQLMSLAQYTALFSLLGTTFGGDGKSTFALPDLRGKMAVGGDVKGQEESFQLVCNALIAATPPGGRAAYPMVGTIAMFGGNYAPQGWMVADGTLLPIAHNVPLFEVIGTTYGGDGASTFALPNLTAGMDPHDPYAPGSAPVGAGTPPGRPPVVLGQKIPPDPRVGVAGLGLNYLICLNGLYPSSGGNGGFPPSDAVVGEVVAYAGATAPVGWGVCDGSLMGINDNEALFSLIGTTYGGDGQTNFALPDLRGRMVMGAEK
jgi:microcystin-dependent protein